MVWCVWVSVWSYLTRRDASVYIPHGYAHTRTHENATCVKTRIALCSINPTYYDLWRKMLVCYGGCPRYMSLCPTHANNYTSLGFWDMEQDNICFQRKQSWKNGSLTLVSYTFTIKLQNRTTHCFINPGKYVLCWKMLVFFWRPSVIHVTV